MKIKTQTYTNVNYKQYITSASLRVTHRTQHFCKDICWKNFSFSPLMNEEKFISLIINSLLALVMSLLRYAQSTICKSYARFRKDLCAR